MLCLHLSCHAHFSVPKTSSQTCQHNRLGPRLILLCWWQEKSKLTSYSQQKKLCQNPIDISFEKLYIHLFHRSPSKLRTSRPLEPTWIFFYTDQLNLLMILQRNASQNESTATILGIAGVSFFGVWVTGLSLFFILSLIWTLRKRKDDMRNLTEQEVKEFLNGIEKECVSQGDLKAHELVDSLPYDKKFEIPRDKLSMETSTNILGRGEFGTVYKGRIKRYSKSVAVKTVNCHCGVDNFKGFLRELKIMIYIGNHPSIVQLIGAATDKIQEKMLYIVIEYCEKGSLQNYLRKCKGSFINQVIDNEIMTGDVADRNLNPYENDIICTADLIRWSYQVALGMTYLASKKVIHADLAARNVLVDGRGNGKITDFGLSRRLFDYSQYIKKKDKLLPFRSMAIESLQQFRFSTQSDVWAYGILLWEIYSIGDMPYPGVDFGPHFLTQLVNGERLVKPAYSTDGIYNLMRSCWNAIPEERPTFDDLTQYFTTLLGTLLYVELEEVAGDTESNPIYLMDLLNQSQSQGSPNVSSQQI